MGQVTTGIEVEAHEGVAGLEHGKKHGLVHLGTGIGLHIGKFATKEFLGAVNRQLLGDINKFTAAIVALARITFGIFVGHDRPLGFQHGPRGDVFRGDQLDLMALATQFGTDRAEDFRIDFLERLIEEIGALLAHGRFPDLDRIWQYTGTA